jgi:predicted RNase H-like HicB family nuclease
MSPRREGRVYAHVPELPEVQTQGENLEQARVMVLDAISMVLEERRARGELIPEPSVNAGPGGQASIAGHACNLPPGSRVPQQGPSISA